ncbi:MAG TPA: tRNA (N(6)-L-threonylcarbamoyladenosine(37)-C(2))-methylthiotransferase MtaB [Oscillospiraceae bacterium]|nr:tRNA (N(6)-L-threonylcarbamoyladenosine(37)-C(2))-methylthiotransferase MtaB [Oscillospiraceae bacterium]HNW04373.1 tRNA (N(6)-L-threonylcarbamoyladenosine(37)-C(2))-methylthiotransferase MtaB [Oscillospiraceae bacterium]
MKAAFYTLGCKVNQYETQIMEQEFRKAGFEIVDCEQEADAYIVNSCTVTGTGDRKSRQMVHRFRREHPSAVVALTGCFPQAFPEQAACVLEADIVLGAADRGGLLPSVLDALDGKRVVHITPHTPDEPFEPMMAEGMLDRTRAFVKIEDGCDNRCAYCIIPKARGFVRSKPLGDLARELELLYGKGYREVVLSGINLPFYGRDLGLRLADAVELACGIMPRVRLSSLEPELLPREDIERFAGMESFCPSFHLSLQSGCDRTLAAMRRRYNTARYREVAANIREVFENPALTTDLMVGFPGETEEDFEESLAFVKEIAFAKVHVFAYSKRPGTDAALLPGQIPNAEKARRSDRVSEAAAETRAAFLQNMLGRTEPVLIESEIRNGLMQGYTKNYVPVTIPAVKSLLCTVQDILITGTDGDVCAGIVKNPPVGYQPGDMFGEEE